MSLSQMIAKVWPEWWHLSPLEAWIVHLSSGQMQGCHPDWPDKNPGLLEGRGSELSPWPHGQICQSSAKPLFQSKRLKIRDHLDEMFGSSGVTLPLQGGHCSRQPSPGWLETGPERSGKSVAKNMNSFHSLGVRGRHPDLASWLQTGQQNGQFLNGSPPYLFFLSHEIKLSKGIRIVIVKICFVPLCALSSIIHSITLWSAGAFIISV